MTPTEKDSVSNRFGQHVKPRAMSQKPTPPPCLLDHILVLDERVYKLQETADYLEYIMVQHINMLDGIGHN